MKEAVEHGGGQDLVAQELLPGVEAAVGGQHHRATGVAVGQELAEGAAGWRVQGVVADLIEDDELGSQPLAEEEGQRAPRVGGLGVEGTCS